MKNSSLVVVGSGIKFLSHLTIEAKSYIEQADKVLYLVNEPAMQAWLQKANASAESLDFLYTKHRLRKDCYREITDYILDQVGRIQHVCVVLYGHPTVFARPALDAAIKAQQKEYDVRIFPGISAEDCLFADLFINPGSSGCQSFDSTDFIIHRRKWDPFSHLILWQVGSIGALDHPILHDNTKGVMLLLNYLRLHYNADHKVVLYEAAQYPTFNPKIEYVLLKEILHCQFSRISTLYVPPAGRAGLDYAALKELNIDPSDLG